MKYKSEPKTIGDLLVAVPTLIRDPSPAGRCFLGSMAVLAASFLFVMYQLVTVGHAAFNTSSDGINWGVAISTYVFFALTSSGLTMVASLATVFGFKQFYPLAKRCIFLAIITLVAGFSVLALELGHPFRMLWTVPTGMQVMSPMFWMGVFYTIDLVLLVVKFYLMWKDDWDSPLSHLVGNAGFVAVILASGMLGLLFGSVAFRPMWFGSFTSVFYILTAALSGAATLILANRWAFDRKGPAVVNDSLQRLFAALIGVAIVMLVIRMWVGLWSNLDGLETFAHLAKSPLFHIELWIGLALPLYLMLSPNARSLGMQVTAAFLVIVAMFINRYEFIITGQMVPMFKGNWTSSLVAYTPSATEWALVVLGVSLTLAMYAYGEKVFDLAATPDSKAVEPAGAARAAS
jgi:Ni/Fe-hydrogenase subunit HybB-like protein